MVNTNTSIVNKYPNIGNISNLEIEGLISDVSEFLYSQSDTPTKADVVGFLQDIGYERKAADELFSFMCNLGAFDKDQYNQISVSDDYIYFKGLEEDNEVIKCIYSLEEVMKANNVTFETAAKYLRHKGYNEKKAGLYLRFLEEKGISQGDMYVWIEEGKDGFIRILGEKAEGNGRVKLLAKR